MAPDPGDMNLRRDLDVLLFAVREGDTRLAELIARAVRRETRAATAPSPLAHRTFDALVAHLGLDPPPPR
jgi:hypothetical protein